jgi:hypothetical protein
MTQVVGNLNSDPTPPAPPANTSVWGIGADGAISRIVSDGYGHAAGTHFVGRAASGTAASPGFKLRAQLIASYDAQPWAGSGFTPQALIQAVATEDHSATALGTGWNVWATLNGSTASQQVAHIGADKVTLPGLPTADPHVADQLWNNGGVLTISAG